MIEFGTTEEEQLFRDTAARFGDEQLREQERDHEKARAYPDTLHKLFGELGLAGINKKDAGLEASHRIAVWSALAAADPAAPFGLDPIGPGGALLGELPDGLGFVVVESRITIDDGKADGTIAWVPRVSLDWLVLVHDNALYLVRNPQWTTLTPRPCGLQASGGLEVNLDGVPCEQIGDGALAAAVLAECRLLAGAVMLGAARDAHDAAAQYGQERIAFGKPIAHHQGLAFQLADAATDLDAAQLLLEASQGHPGMVANAHAHACEVAQQVCERAVQVLGGHGYLYDHRVEKRMRDVRSTASLYGGSMLSELDAAASVLDFPDPLEMAS